MDDLIARIKAEKWHMRLACEPNGFDCWIWDDLDKMKHGFSKIAPDSAIIDAIREMDSR